MFLIALFSVEFFVVVMAFEHFLFWKEWVGMDWNGLESAFRRGHGLELGWSWVLFTLHISSGRE